MWLALGVGLGVLTACLVEDPEPKSVLGSVLANTYSPFSHWGLCLLCLVVGVVLCYCSASRAKRPLFWCYVLAVGYVLGRVAAFAAMAGVCGIVSICLCEVPFALLPLAFAVGYYCALREVVLYTLLPRCNPAQVKVGVRYLVCGALVCFVYVVVLWGVLSLVINLV